MPKISDETKQQSLIASLVGARSQVLTAASVLLPVNADLTFLGVWSLHDIIAHLVGWDYANLTAIAAIRSGRLPDFYSAFDTDWHTFNALLVRRHKQATLHETLVCAAASHQALIQALLALPADDLTRDFGVRSPRGRRVTIGMLLQAEASDEHKHAEQIKAFARQIEE